MARNTGVGFVLERLCALVSAPLLIRDWSQKNVCRAKAEAEPQTKIFHATMLITRAEEWWVEAESLEEAQALLAAGRGHRGAAGELLHVELDAVLASEDG
jgi:hypothetical protein